VRTCGGDIAA